MDYGVGAVWALYSLEGGDSWVLVASVKPDATGIGAYGSGTVDGYDVSGAWIDVAYYAVGVAAYTNCATS